LGFLIIAFFIGYSFFEFFKNVYKEFCKKKK
jgi:hypothetical protein